MNSKRMKLGVFGSLLATSQAAKCPYGYDQEDSGLTDTTTQLAQAK